MKNFYFICYFKINYDNSFIIKNDLINQKPFEWVKKRKGIKIINWKRITEIEYNEYKQIFKLLNIKQG